MTHNFFVVLAAFFILSLQASFARAADPDSAGIDKRCVPQQIKIQALEHDRESMAAEIYHLQDEIRRLNEILNNIRRQIGHGEPRPTSR